MITLCKKENTWVTFFSLLFQNRKLITEFVKKKAMWFT